MRRFLLSLAFVMLGWAALDRGTAQAQPPAPALPRATVTANEGDHVGGTFFGRPPDPQKVRHYYIAAEPELWDYAPAGRDEVCGQPLPPTVLANRFNGKLRYVQYTDETFRAKIIPNRTLGILGPVLRGVVGEFLVVTFLNRTGQPISMHPHGVRYDKDSEGAFYFPSPGRGAAVGPGARFTYVWQLDADSGPWADEPSSKAWLYHSHVAGDAEVNLGLVGCIVVTDPTRARPDGTPADVDREFATLFMIFDESGLGEDVKEAAEYAGLPGTAPAAKTWTQIQELTEQGSRYAINGRIFGNLSGLEMNEGERTRWYLFALGSERDFHTAHWHGLRVVESRRGTDVVELLPASMKVADIVADNPGSWLFHCHVTEHMQEGMFARFVVHSREVVGVDRTPAAAFLGCNGASESLRLTRVEAIVPSSAGGTGAEIRLEGVVSVFEAFSIFTQPIRIRLGEKNLSFRPDAKGAVQTGGGRLRIKNANPFGVVYGGLMEFEIILQGAEWFDELKKFRPAAVERLVSNPITVSLSIGAAEHRAAAHLSVANR